MSYTCKVLCRDYFLYYVNFILILSDWCMVWFQIVLCEYRPRMWGALFSSYISSSYYEFWLHVQCNILIFLFVAQAYQVYSDRLLTHAWQHWNQRWFTRRSLAQRQEQVDRLGNQARMRRVLTHWRFCILYLIIKCLLCFIKHFTNTTNWSASF